MHDALLRSYVRELAVPVPSTGPVSVAGFSVPVLYRSVTGWHRFGLSDLAVLAPALVRAACDKLGLPHDRGTDATARILDSARRTAEYVAARRAEPDDPPGTTPFLAAEQALLHGHPFHPMAKSRDSDASGYAPELRESFPLHWFAADPSVVAGGAVGLWPPRAQSNRTMVPAHPWQARDVLSRPGIQALLDAGLLTYLGPSGPEWFPTSSVRTVYRPGSPVMLKLSLGMRITNSRRNNLRSELELGARIARLFDAGLSARLAAVHSAFGIVRDPAWISVDVPGGETESGLETAVRQNPFRAGSGRVACVAGLVDEGTSRLAGIVRRLALAAGRSTHDVSAEWFARYLAVLAAPLLWLHRHWGLGLEAHQQNTVVRLDAGGWPIGAWYRDSQGYYVRESQLGNVRSLLPGVDDGVPLVFGDALTDDRVIYYLVVNNLFGLVGALGSAGVADEAALLGVLRGFLARSGGPFAERLLTAPTLPCKANFLTGVDGRDELVGDVATQSVYVEIPNPLVVL